jgi:hypothetical protein
MARKSKKVSAWDKYTAKWDKFAESLKRDLNITYADPEKHYWGFVVVVDIENMQTGEDLGGTNSYSGNLTGEELGNTVSGLYMDIANALNGLEFHYAKDGSAVLANIRQIWMYPVYERLESHYDPEEDEYVFSPPRGSGDFNADYDAEPIWSWSLDSHTQKVAGGYSTPPLFYNASDTPGHSGWVYADPRYSS